MPQHPIVLPPGTEKPPLGIWSEPILPPEIPADGFWGGVPPLQIWGDPIYPEDSERQKIIEWHAGWTLRTGWVIVGVPSVPFPTPSK
jgi:hypothetical protein